MVELSLRGDLDGDRLTEYAARLGGVPSDADLVVDFGGVTFCGSAGIRVLVQTWNRLVEGGGSVQVRSASNFVRRTFEVTGTEFLLNGLGDADDRSSSQAS